MNITRNQPQLDSATIYYDKITTPSTASNLTLQPKVLMQIDRAGYIPFLGSLKVDWKDDGTNHATGNPLIVFNSGIITDINTYNLKSLLVKFNGGIPRIDSYTNKTIDTKLLSYPDWTPALALNRQDDRFMVTDGTGRSFCRYIANSGGTQLKQEEVEKH